MQKAMPINGNTGENGTLKGRFISGRVRRSTMTPILTRTKAKSVPMLTSSTMAPNGTKAASNEIRMPKPIVSLAGVPNRGCTCASRRGKSPSRHMAKKIRVWPYMITKTTLVIATSAPRASTPPAQAMPAPSRSPAASGASLPVSVSIGATPIAAIATMT